MNLFLILILQQRHLHDPRVVRVQFIHNRIYFLIWKLRTLFQGHFFEVLNEALPCAEVIDTSCVERIALNEVYI